MINRNTLAIVFILCMSIFVGLMGVLYINGYSISFVNGKTNIVKGGNLYIVTNPKGANIYLDGSLKGKSPYTFSNIEPGDYDLEITKDGYNKWSDTINVAEGFVSNIKISLFPVNQAISSVSTRNVS